MATSAPRSVDRSTDTCPRCLGRVTHDPREDYCAECGLVVDDAPTDFGQEWRDFDDRDPARGASPGDRNFHDNGMGSFMGRADEREGEDRRRAIWDNRTRSKRDRNRNYATSEVHRIAAALDVPTHVRERGQRLFREIHGRDEAQGKDLDTLAATCAFAACRLDGQGIVASEVAEVARADESAIRRRFRWLQQELALEVPPPDVCQRVRVVAGRMDVDRATVNAAVERSRGVRWGGAPSSLAAWCLYAESDATQRACADAASVTPAALRQCGERVTSS